MEKMHREVKTVPALYARKPDAHKGEFGRVVVIAGSPGMTGAGCLAARAALRSGAGLVTLAVPESLLPLVAGCDACLMTRSCAESPSGGFSMTALDSLLAFCSKADAVAIGPGMGRDEETWRLVRALYEKLEKALVLDADGLNAVAADAVVLKRAPVGRRTVLTPHPGEMSRLTGVNASVIQSDRKEAASRFASRYSVTLALKGAGTIVADSEKIFINSTGNPGMATAGSGDVLTGVMADCWRKAGRRSRRHVSAYTPTAWPAISSRRRRVRSG
jgi:NAD(P)H-hydrate epimerase